MRPGINGIYKVIDHTLVTQASGAFVRLNVKKHASSIYDWDPATQEQAYNPDAGPEVNDAEGDKWYSGDGEPDDGVDGDIGDRFVDKQTGNVWRRVN